MRQAGAIPPSVVALRPRFLAWVRRERPEVTDSTAIRYWKYATQFCASYGHPRGVTEAQVVQWRESIATVQQRDGTLKPAAASTVNVKIAALRAFFAFLVREGIRSDDPTRDALVMVPVPKRQPKPLSRSAINEVFRLLYSEPDTDELKQDRALIETLYGSGLRRQEAAVLTLGAFEGQDRLRVIGKGDKERLTVVTSRQYEAVRDWALRKHGDAVTVSLLRSNGPDKAFDDLRKRKPDAPLFFTSSGQPLATLDDPGKFVWRRCARYLAKAGLSGSPHQFRHSFGTHLLSGGLGIYEVSQLMGHEDLNTTRGYLGLEDAVFEKARHAHPRA